HEQAKTGANVDTPAEGPRSAEKNGGTTPAAESTAKLEIDDSLRTLIGPPPVLGATEKAGGDHRSESNSLTHNHLSKGEVIDLSDAEARRQGYDLSRYQRPDPQFDRIDNTWSLSYVGK